MRVSPPAGLPPGIAPQAIEDNADALESNRLKAERYREQTRARLLRGTYEQRALAYMAGAFAPGAAELARLFNELGTSASRRSAALAALREAVGGYEAAGE